MKTKIIPVIVCIFNLLSSFVFSQEAKFKSVTSAQDVIDNYLISNGGADNLKKIKSIKMNGSLDYMGTEIPVTVFINSDVFFINVESKEFPIKTAYDNTKKTGWNQFGSEVKDMTEKDIEKMKQAIESNLSYYYYDKEKYNISYEMLQNEKVNDKDCYVVTFKKSEKELFTNYYDTSNYNRLKTETPAQSTIFEDFKFINEYNISMPYKVIQQFTTVIKNYEFNTSFYNKLLKKPKK